MAVEKIGVRHSRVLGVGIGSVVILVVVRIGLTTYFTKMTDLEMQTKRVATGVERIHAIRADEARALDKAAVPLARAMSAVANQQRAVEPKQSTDNAAVEGWKELPKAALGTWPLPPPLPGSNADAGDASADGAGASSPSATADAGAPPPHPPEHH
jgi:hypothetical protein